jgi:regulator of protease activity HflC (stomatin/prohibitin superfamily)
MMVKFKRWARENAPHLFILVFFVIFMLAFLAPRIFITIPAGHGAVLFSRMFGGTMVDTTYQEGLRLFFPWDTVTIYKVREQVLTLDLTALTSDGLSVQVGVSVRFRPNGRLLGTLHKEHGPDYVDSFLAPEVESATRQTIGSNKPVDLYSTARNLMEKQTESLLNKELRQFDEFFSRSWPMPSADQMIPRDSVDHRRDKDPNLRMLIKYLTDRQENEALMHKIKDVGLVNLFVDYFEKEKPVKDARNYLKKNIYRLQKEREKLYLVEDSTTKLDSINMKLDSLVSISDTLESQVYKGEKQLNILRSAYDHFFRIIELKDVLITKIELPQKIRDAIQSKLHQEQIVEEFDFRLARERKEAQRQLIEAQGIRDFQAMVSVGIEEGLLKWKAIEATLELAKSNNAKMIVIGAGEDGLPIILGNQGWDHPVSDISDSLRNVQLPASEAERSDR